MERTHKATDFNGCQLKDTYSQQEKTPAKLCIRRKRQQGGEKVGWKALKHGWHAVGSRHKSNIQGGKDPKRQM